MYKHIGSDPVNVWINRKRPRRVGGTIETAWGEDEREGTG